MDTIDMFGETFAIADKIAEVHFMEFAEASSDGLSDDVMEGFAAIWRFVKHAIAKDDVRDDDGKIVAHGVKRFVTLARKNDASTDDLLQVIRFVFTGETGRPTGASSVSSDGRDATPAKSESSAEGKVAELFPGRPDMAVAVLRATQTA